MAVGETLVNENKDIQTCGPIPGGLILTHTHMELNIQGLCPRLRWHGRQSSTETERETRRDQRQRYGDMETRRHKDTGTKETQRYDTETRDARAR